LPRQRHVAKVAQSATATWAISMPSQTWSGPRDLFKQIFFYREVFQTFFLQGRKSKPAQITGTIMIFKP